MKEYHTQYRDWMMEYFENHKDAIISPAHLYQEMKDSGITLNQATVYRNLDHLEKDGRIRGLKVSDHDEKFYQYLDPDHHCASHLHLYCRKCGRVIHMDNAFMQQLNQYLKKMNGFELDCRDSVLVGLCSECRKEEEQK